MEEDDLVEAYRRAGNTFNRQMRQTFVVLKDESGVRASVLAARGRGGFAPAPRGRPYRGRGAAFGLRGGRGSGGNDQRGQKRASDESGTGTGYGFVKKALR